MIGLVMGGQRDEGYEQDMTSEPSPCSDWRDGSDWWSDDVDVGEVRRGPQSESSREREAWRAHSRVRGGGGEELVLTFAPQEFEGFQVGRY